MSGFGVGLAAALLWLAGLLPAGFDNLAYDAMMRATADPSQASDRIRLVLIDEASLRWVQREMGESWPWPREYHGVLLRALRRWGARVVAFDIIFDQSGSRRFGLGDTEAFVRALKEAGGAVLVGAHDPGTPAPEPPRGFGLRVRDAPWGDAALEAAAPLTTLPGAVYLERDGEQAHLWLGGFADAATATESLVQVAGSLLPFLNGVDLPVSVRADREALRAAAAEILARRIAPVPPEAERVDPHTFLRRYALERAPGGSGVDTLPAPVFLASAAGFGVAEQEPDADGVLRRFSLTARLRSGLYPSFPLAIYLAAQQGPVPVRREAGTLRVGSLRVPLEPDGRTRVRVHGEMPYHPLPAFQVLRAALLEAEGKPPGIDTRAFRDTIVIVAGAAVSLTDRKVSSISKDQIGSDLVAATVDALLRGHFVRQAPRLFTAGAIVAMGVLAALLGAFATEPRHLSGLVGPIGSVLRLAVRGLMAIVALALVVGPLLGLAVYLFGTFDFWVPIAVPVASAGGAMMTALGVLEYVEHRDRQVIHQALGIYTSDLIANLVASGGVRALDARRDDVSVYFSDLEGFTSFSEDLPPERLAALLSEYLTAMTEVILEHGGIVDKYIGDAIMAFWGWRESQPDHAVRAVRAALAMRDRLAELRPRWEAHYGVTLRARAGIHTGVCVVGNLGSAQKMNVTLLGDVVNLASRLEGANKSYRTEIMVGEATYEAAREHFVFRELDLLQVKGKARPVRVFEPLGPAGEGPAQPTWKVCFEAGLRAYRQRRFSEAEAAFRQVLDLRPEDGPARLYLERCAHYLERPPDPSWNGVFVLRTK